MTEVRFAAIGTGNITRWFLRGAYEDPRFRCTAVCSRNAAKAEAFAAAYPGMRPCCSTEQIAADSEIDAVYIATPNSTHASIATEMMEAGKHVLIEKPAASNAEEWKAMTGTAKKHGVTLMEAMLPTMSPNFRIIMESIPLLGKVCRYSAHYCQYSSRLALLEAGKKPNVFLPTMSGGATMDIGVYTLYPMVALFGMPREIKVTATLLPTGVDGAAAVSMRYGDDMESNVVYSKTDDSYLPSEIAGTSGNLLMDSIHLIHSVDFIAHRTPSSGQGPAPEAKRLGEKPERDDYYYETAEFIDLILSGRKQSSVNSWDNSLLTLVIADEIRSQAGVTFPADRAAE